MGQNANTFLGELEKLRKENTNVCLPVCRLSNRMEHLSYRWRGFLEILYFSIYRKSVERIQGSVESDQNNGYFT